MIQKLSLLLKKEARRISLWLIISLWSENRKDESLVLIYMITLGEVIHWVGFSGKDKLIWVVGNVYQKNFFVVLGARNRLNSCPR